MHRTSRTFTRPTAPSMKDLHTVAFQNYISKHIPKGQDQRGALIRK